MDGSSPQKSVYFSQEFMEKRVLERMEIFLRGLEEVSVHLSGNGVGCVYNVTGGLRILSSSQKVEKYDLHSICYFLQRITAMTLDQ